MIDFSKAYNRADFVNYLRRDFLPDDFEQEESNVTFWSQMSYASVATCLGKSKTLDLVVYEIKHTSRHDARVGLSKDAFRMLAGEKQSRALVIFIPEDDANNYRFSLIEIQLSIGENDSNVTRTYSNPRRYSYYLGKGIACSTPNKYLNEQGRVKDVKDLFERFSVEVLTKAFYQELSDWYAWAIKVISFPNDITKHTDDKLHNHEGAIRLITRLIFVWFLKERKLIPWQFFDQEYIANHLIKGFNPHKIANLFGKSEASVYYRAILQNLFFAMLNCPITKEGSTELTERRFKDNRSQFDDNKLMRYRDEFNDPDEFLRLANETVPFLNGGLFDCLDEKRTGMYYDGFSERKESMAQLIVPDYLFFGEEAGKNIDLSEFYGDANKKKVSARGIIDILKRYNFTVEENMPFDKDVSLDPELLGKVFENLLASYNPETQQTARKKTGSFYTPREIVQYMVDESLVAHLKRTVGDELEDEYRKLLTYADNETALTEQQKLAIMQSLYNCKILDPACGSGAFPVGVLQQMVHILTQIDPDNSRWQKMLFDIALDENSSAYQSLTKEEQVELKDDLYRSFNENFNRPDYSRKLYLIENCIYGVDIQPIAIQISKLRFFISLVVDQKINNNPADNFGIRPLPNLEAKFVTANSLIGLNRREVTLFDNTEIKDKEAKLKIAKHKIFSAKTSKTKEKYREQVRRLRKEIADLLIEQRMVGNEQAQQLEQWDMFDQNASSPFFDPEWMFGVKGGFDIVIANPPYGANIDKFIELYEKLYPNTSHGFKDIYKYFFDRGFQLLTQRGCLTYITPNTYLRQPRYKDLRKVILSNGIWQILDLGEHIFDAVVPTAIAVTVKGVCSNTIFADLTNRVKDEDVVFVNIPFVSIAQETFNSTPSNIFVISSSTHSVKTVPLSEILLMKDAGFKYQRVKVGLSQKGKSDLPQRLFYVGDVENPNDIPILIGKEINEFYHKTEPQKHLRANFQSLLNDNEVTYYNAEIMSAPTKLIWRQTAPYFIGTVLSKRIFFGNTIQAGVILDKYKSSVSYEYLCGLLNSTYLRHLYEENVRETGRVFPQVKLEKLRPIPIVIPEEAQRQAVEDLTNCIIRCKQNDVHFDTSNLQEQLDIYVFKLYDLSYDIITDIIGQPNFSREEYDNFKL